MRDYDYYSNLSRGARRLIEKGDGTAGSIRIDEPPANTRPRAAWARLIQKIYEVDPLTCVNCGSNMRIIKKKGSNRISNNRFDPFIRFGGQAVVKMHGEEIVKQVMEKLLAVEAAGS